MHLIELIDSHAMAAETGVPDWMVGYFKRRAISFADGTTDLATQVCWLQSRNFTIDLRLPITSELIGSKALDHYTERELRTLGNHEGWEAPCQWQDGILSWHKGTSLQYHDRWTEPGILHRVGNCMIELSPNGTYIEDWRLQPSAAGPLLGLRLIDDICLDSGTVQHLGGGLIICGDYAALVLGRPTTAPISSTPNQYREELVAAQGQLSRLEALMKFETSVAKGSAEGGYQIQLSTNPSRSGESLLPLDGFELDSRQQRLIQQFVDSAGRRRQRRFSIDTLESQCQFAQATPVPKESARWQSLEADTLTRYTEAIY